MNILVDYKENDLRSVKVSDVKYLGDFAMRIKFDDGTERLVDFKPFLTESAHPSIKKYLDEKVFNTYEIVDGNLNWNDYDLIFPIWDLYQGKIKG